MKYFWAAAIILCLCMKMSWNKMKADCHAKGGLYEFLVFLLKNTITLVCYIPWTWFFYQNVALWIRFLQVYLLHTYEHPLSVKKRWGQPTKKKFFKVSTDCPVARVIALANHRKEEMITACTQLSPSKARQKVFIHKEPDIHHIHTYDISNPAMLEYKKWAI